MRVIRIIIVAYIILISPFIVNASDQIPASAQTQPIALINAVIHPVTSSVIDIGIILFDGGKIIDLGKNINIPSNALIVDVAGKHVYPGMIESHSQLGLVEIASARPTRDSAEMGDINPNVCAEVAVNPESEHFPVTRANGITMAVTLPTGGVLAGKSALLTLDGWTYEEMTYKAPISMILNWPKMKLAPNWWAPQLTKEKLKEKRERQLKSLDKAYKDATAYKKAHDAVGGKFHKHDVRWAAMMPVLNGDLPLWIKANTILEIETAVSWADKRNLKIVLLGGSEAYHVTDLLKRKNIPVIITSILRLPGRRDADFDEAFTLPKKLHEAGVKYCISSGGGSNTRNLPYHAAKAAAYGLSKDEALKSITLYPAEIIGVADRVGSLEKGKDATLIITNGDPLEITTNVDEMYIQGRKIDLSSQHTIYYEKYKKRYQ